MDLAQTDSDTITLQGDVAGGSCGEIIPRKPVLPPYTYTSLESIDYVESNILGRWTRQLQDDSQISLQVYWDKLNRQSAILDIYHDTIDIDFQHSFRLDERNEIIWGLAYRYLYEDTDPTFDTAIIPEEENQSLYSGFIQNQITIIEQILDMTIGSKFEVNSYTGLEIQPSIRLAWTPNSTYSVWGSVSRAVRTPSRGEYGAWLTSVVYPPGTYDPTITIPVAVRAYGNHDMESEEMIAYETGFRAYPRDNISLDIAFFYNDYKKLRTQELLPTMLRETIFTPHFTIPVTARNGMNGSIYGLELAADWQVYDWLNMKRLSRVSLIPYRFTPTATPRTTRSRSGQPWTCPATWNWISGSDMLTISGNSRQ